MFDCLLFCRRRPVGRAFQPDGKLIACGYGGKLAIFSIEGGQPLKNFDLPRLANLTYGMGWTPDSKAVTYPDWTSGIWKQSLDGGEPQRLEGLPEEKIFGHSWSRDGRLFAFARRVQIRDLFLFEKCDKDLRRLVFEYFRHFNAQAGNHL